MRDGGGHSHPGIIDIDPGQIAFIREQIDILLVVGLEPVIFFRKFADCGDYEMVRDVHFIYFLVSESI